MSLVLYDSYETGGLVVTLWKLNANEARSRWRDIVDAAASGDSDVVVERYGKPMVAIIPYEDYAELVDELDDIRAARRAATAYEAWLQDPSLGRSMEEVEKDLREEGVLDD